MEIVIHNECGNRVEKCTCKDAQVKPIAYCYNCGLDTTYTCRNDIWKEMKGVEINAEIFVPVCDACGEGLFVEIVDNDNLESIYSKYEEVTGVNPRKYDTK